MRGRLDLLPKGCKAAVEFRHPSGFDDEVYGLLREWRAALCGALGGLAAVPDVDKLEDGQR